MKKKTASVFLSVVLLTSCALPVMAKTIPDERQLPRLVDDANFLDEEEKSEIEEKLDSVSEEYECDVAVVTADGIDGQDIVDYADDFFDYNGYGMGEDKNGILLAIDMDTRKWNISTHGEAETLFTSEIQDDISDSFLTYLSDGEYLNAFEDYADSCAYYLSFYAEDEDALAAGYEYDDYDEYDDYEYSSWYIEDYIPQILISIGIGFVIALIVTGVMRGKMKSVRMKANAADYLVDNSLEVTRSHDLFLYTRVTKTEKPKNDDSDDNGHHISSSGESHGGSSGSF